MCICHCTVEPGRYLGSIRMQLYCAATPECYIPTATAGKAAGRFASQDASTAIMQPKAPAVPVPVVGGFITQGAVISGSGFSLAAVPSLCAEPSGIRITPVALLVSSRGFEMPGLLH